MICVSIGRGRHRHVIAEHKHLVEQGAQLVELRLDYIRSKVNLTRLIDDRPCPVIVTVRREQDGGRFEGTEEQRRILLRAAIAAGVDYVDLEEDTAAAIPRFGKTKRIVSIHDFRKTPDNLEEIHARLAALDADIVKIATMANQTRDNLRMLQLIANSEVPTVGLCMGDIGTPSRILGGRFGAPFTYATFHHERQLAPGQLTFQEMVDIYHYDSLTKDTEVYGVIGDPIGHSLSPLIHNACFRQQKLDKVYLPLRVSREDLPNFFADARALGIRGLSVTIPHKESVLGELTKMDRAVEGIGAANTVIFEGEENIGHNTDYQAAMDSLRATVKSLGHDERWFRERTALVLGAGGAAKAIGYGLKQLGAKVLITNRTTERAEELAEHLDCGGLSWDRRHEVEPDLLINCTPVGMHPKVDETPFDQARLKQSTIVFDTVYNPENTLLIKDARKKGCVVISGVEMFVRQAALQYERFTGKPAPTDLMREVLKKATGAAKY